MPQAREFRASKSFTVFVVSTSIFSETLLLNVLVPILPFLIRERLRLDEVLVQKWCSILLAAHGFAMIVGSLLFGLVGDRLPNQKLPFLLSLALPAAATLCFTTGSSLLAFLMARLLQGFSGAAVSTLGRTMLLHKVGHERIGRAMGYTGMAASVGMLLGPVVGGALFELVGSHAVFLVPAGMLVAEMILRILVIDGKSSLEKIESPEVTDAPPERGRDTNLSNGTAPTNPQEHQTADKRSLSPTQPLLGRGSGQRNPLWVLLTRLDFAVALSSSFVLNGLANGFDAILPTYSMNEFNLTSSRVAVLFLCLGTPMILSPLAGHLIDTYGSKTPMLSGLLCLAPCLFFLQFISREVPHALTMLGTLLALAGSCLCLAIQPLQIDVTTTVKEIEEETPNIFGYKSAYSLAYGLMNMSFAAGAMIGPIFTGFLCAALGWQWTLLVMSATSCMVLSSVVIVIWTRKRRADQEQ